VLRSALGFQQSALPHSVEVKALSPLGFEMKVLFPLGLEMGAPSPLGFEVKALPKLVRRLSAHRALWREQNSEQGRPSRLSREVLVSLQRH